MPITYVLDKTRRLIRAEVVGSFTAADMLQCVTGAAAEAGEPGWNVISDHRAISHPATRGQLEQLTSQLTEMHRHFAGARWAVVTTNPASFGMMRMLQVLALRVPMELDIFARYDEAERWASVHVPDDSPSG